MAKTLDAWGEDYVEEPERGFKHNWREDLVKQLAGRQKEDGSWVNEAHNRWHENSPVLCTAYALNALRHTR
jgi:squalene-hopene/tetraprenyl-beta-curcumene cyclase